MTITELAVGQCATVSGVSGDTRTAIRIMELGVIPGSVVEMRGRSFGNLRLAVGSTRLALAAELARRVTVAPMSPAEVGR